MAALPAVALDHVGVAAPAATTPLTALLGSDPLEGREMPSGVTVARFGPAATMELVWPGRPGTPVDGFLAKRGPGLHHVALRVDEDLGALVERLRAQGGVFTGPDIELSSDGRRCVFLHPASTGGVLVELVEGPRP